jgi:hypothetical protein
MYGHALFMGISFSAELKVANSQATGAFRFGDRKI